MDRSWSLSSSQHLDNLAGRAEREREGGRERERRRVWMCRKNNVRPEEETEREQKGGGEWRNREEV